MSTHRKVGRSIEEVMVRRKFDSSNPVTWPDGHPSGKTTKISQSLPDLKNEFSAPGTAESREPARSHVQIVRDITTAAGPVRGTFDYLKDYSEADKVKMMESLIRYTKTLQDRVESLESQLVAASEAGMPRLLLSSSSTSKFAVARNLTAGNPFDAAVSATSDPRIMNSRPGSTFAGSVVSHGGNHMRRTISAQGNVDPAQQALVSQIMSDIDYKVFNLKEIFRKGDPVADRKRGAELIGALVRGYLCRQRLQKFKRGVREWRWVRCRPVTYIIDILLAIHSKRETGYHLMKTNRTMKTLTMFFGKWSGVWRHNAPMRRAIKAAAAEKINNKRIALLRRVFTGLKEVSVGDLSTRNANMMRRKLIESIRHELSEKYKQRTHNVHLGVVPEHEVQKILHRRVLEQFLARQKTLHLSYTYRALKNNLLLARRFMKAARHKHFTHLAGKCFYAWSNYTYLVALGLDRKRWPGPRKYEVKYNQKRVDNFSRIRYQRSVFRAWKAYFMIQYKVKRKYQAKLTQFVRGMFFAWAEVSHTQHRLRLSTYQNWKDYPRVMMIKPFEAWANHVRAVKNHDAEQMRICKSYVRWKWRQRVLTILKVWRHQALYGRIDGLYSRQMLLKTLAEQKFAANLLEKHMSDQTLELEECRTIVAKEIEKRKNLEDELKVAVTDRDKNKMTNHHFEQELRRVQSIIDCMVQLNPHQVKHIQKIQPDFRFKNRNIVLSKEPSAEERVAAAEAKAARKAANEAEDRLEREERLRAAEEAGELGDEDVGEIVGGTAAGASAVVVPVLGKQKSIVGGTASATATGTATSATSAAGMGISAIDTSDGADSTEDGADTDDKLSSMPELSHQLTTIEESAESLDSPTNSSRLASGMQTPSKSKSAFQASRANSHNRSVGGFNDSSSTIDADISASADSVGNGVIEETSDEAAADGSVKEPAPASSAGAGLLGSPEQLTLSAPALNTDADDTEVRGVNISEEDRVLLLRVKWLLSKFHDSQHQAESEAHTKSSLELMKDAQELQQKNLLAAQMKTAEALAKDGVAARSDAHDPRIIGEGSLYPVLERPSLFPSTAPKDMNAIMHKELEAQGVEVVKEDEFPASGAGAGGGNQFVPVKPQIEIPRGGGGLLQYPSSPAASQKHGSPVRPSQRGLLFGQSAAPNAGGDSFSAPLGSFSASPDGGKSARYLGGSPSRKSPEQIAADASAAVQAAIAAASDPNNPINSSQAPFEPQAPQLKNQVKQLSRHFSSVMRQSSSAMYRSMRGDKMSHSKRGMSAHSDMDDSALDEDLEDIPLAEIDEIDCLKNASVKILLSFIEFLEEGNVSSFQPEDRRDWVKNLLAAAHIQETEEEKEIKEAARFAAERWGGGADGFGNEDDQQDDLLARVPAPMLGSLDKERTMKRLDSSSALITVDGAESAISWRVRLMQLRALNANVGNASGKTEPIEDEKEISMFNRILDMRSKLEGIIQLQTIKYQRQLTLMLRDSKQKQRELDLANAIASAQQPTGADRFPGPGQSPQRVFGHKYPAPIKTAFTPAMTIPESPMTPATGFGTFGHTPDGGTSAHGSFGENLNAAGEVLHNPLLPSQKSPEKAVTAKLGSNIYAGNLRMMAKTDEEAERRANAARPQPKDSFSEQD